MYSIITTCTACILICIPMPIKNNHVGPMVDSIKVYMHGGQEFSFTRIKVWVYE